MVEVMPTLDPAALAQALQHHGLAVPADASLLPALALEAAGAPGDAVAAALAQAAGLGVCPDKVWATLTPALAEGLPPASVFAGLLAVPVARSGTRLAIAFADPTLVGSPAAQALPPHTPVVGALERVRAGALRVWPLVLDQTVVPTPVGPQGPLPLLPEAGSQVGDYRVERRLGQGGMATVYLATDALGMPVALKVMRPELAQEPDYLKRFLQEAEAARALLHPHVVAVLGTGTAGGLPYIATEYVDGGSVDDLLRAGGPMPTALALELMGQLLAGAAVAHDQGVIHRDLKPANLLLTRQGVLKVADFGIAKRQSDARLTQTGMVLGTPAYMSPEQAMAKVLGPPATCSPRGSSSTSCCWAPTRTCSSRPAPSSSC
jgi:hypothetical protein